MASFKYRHEGSERYGLMWRKSVVGTRYEKYKEKGARVPSCGLISRISMRPVWLGQILRRVKIRSEWFQESKIRL